MATANTPRASKNVNGIFVLPDLSMIADETKGPMKEDALPIRLNKAKKRNWTISTAGGGKEGEGNERNRKGLLLFHGERLLRSLLADSISTRCGKSRQRTY